MINIKHSVCYSDSPYRYTNHSDWIRKEDVMPIIQDKIAYAVTFLRPSGDMRLIEYRQEGEEGWQGCKTRMFKRTGVYIDYAAKYGYKDYIEAFLTQAQVDNLSTSYDTTNTSIRALGISGEELDFKSD